MYWFFKVLGKYATFKGRARRKEYWLFTLFYLIFYAVMMLLDIAFGLDEAFYLLPHHRGRQGMLPFGWFEIFYLLITFLPALAVSIRRLHDIGKSGWWTLCVFIPIIGMIICHHIYLYYLIHHNVVSGYSEWSAFFAFLMIFGSIILFIFACKNSQVGANKYGENPKGQNIAQSIVVIPTKTNNVQNDTKECPFCGEKIQNVAKKCRYCGEWFEGKPTAVEISSSEEKESVTENVNN